MSTVKKLYTVIRFMSDGIEIDTTDIRSFDTFRQAEDYAFALKTQYEIVESEYTVISV